MMHGEITHGMSNREYHSIDALNASALKVLEPGMSRDSARMLLEQMKDMEPSPAMEFGTACHTLLLEPDRANETIGIGPTKTRGTKAWNEWLTRTHGEFECRITQEEWERLQGITRSVQQHPRALNLLGQGDPEVTCQWRERGVLCRARADRIFWHAERETWTILELKTTRDEPTPQNVAAAIRRFGYDLAAHWYTRGFATVLEEPVDLIFLFVRSSDTFAPALYRLSAETMDRAEAQVEQRLDVYLESLKLGPQNYDDIVELDI